MQLEEKDALRPCGRMVHLLIIAFTDAKLQHSLRPLEYPAIENTCLLNILIGG